LKHTIVILYLGAFAAMASGIAADAQTRETGIGIADSAKNLIADIALSYISHTDQFIYGGMFTAFRRDLHPVGDKWEINCSTFCMLVSLGIRFEDSVYGGGNNRPGVSAFYRPDLAEYMKSGTEGMQSSYVFSQHIAQWLYQKGLCFYPNPDLSNVETGDILFFNNNASIDEHVFSGINHSGIFAYHIHENLWGIWEVQNAGPVYAEYTHQFNSKVVLCARLPKESNVFPTSPINTDPTKKYASEEKILRPLTNLYTYKPGKQYTLVAKIKYSSPDLVSYPGIQDSKNTSLCSYHNLKERPLDDIYRLPFVPQTEDDCIYLDTRVSVSGADMSAICEWAFVYEGLLF